MLPSSTSIQLLPLKVTRNSSLPAAISKTLREPPACGATRAAPVTTLVVVAEPPCPVAAAGWASADTGTVAEFAGAAAALFARPVVTSGDTMVIGAAGGGAGVEIAVTCGVGVA